MNGCFYNRISSEELEKEILKRCAIGIDLGKGESQTAMQRKIEIGETEKRIKELQQYKYYEKE